MVTHNTPFAPDGVEMVKVADAAGRWGQTDPADCRASAAGQRDNSVVEAETGRISRRASDVVAAPAALAAGQRAHIWGREASRLLALLKQARERGVPVAAMRDQGIEAPALAMYALQLAGYTIDRLPDPGPPRYRLGRRRHRWGG